MLLRSALALLALAAPALAGGYAPVIVAPAPAAPVIVPPPAMPASDWSGFYLGAQIGTADAETTYETVVPVPPGLAIEGSGGLLGLHAGYRRDFGRLVLGGELDWDTADIALESTFEGPTETLGTISSIARAKLQLGFDAGRVLPYLTAGVARASLDYEDTMAAMYLEDTGSGRFVGVGAAFAVSDRLAIGLEALRHDFADTPAYTIPAPVTFDTAVDTITLRGSWRF